MSDVRRLLVPVPVVVVLGLLVAIGAVALTLGVRHADAPSQRTQAVDEVAVFLRAGVTPEQRQAVESALRALRPIDEVPFDSSEQAYQAFREEFRDAADLLRVTVAHASVRCVALDPIRHLAGVDGVVMTELVPTAPNAPPRRKGMCR